MEENKTCEHKQYFSRFRAQHGINDRLSWPHKEYPGRYFDEISERWICFGCKKEQKIKINTIEKILKYSEFETIKEVERLLDMGGDVNAWNGTPLCRAVQNKSLDAVRRILRAHADPNIKGGTPLCLAVESKYLEMVELLLNHGADPMQNQQEALRIGFNKGYLEIILLFHKFESLPYDQERCEHRFVCLKCGKHG